MIHKRPPTRHGNYARNHQPGMSRYDGVASPTNARVRMRLLPCASPLAIAAMYSLALHQTVECGVARTQATGGSSRRSLCDVSRHALSKKCIWIDAVRRVRPEDGTCFWVVCVCARACVYVCVVNIRVPHYVL